MRVIDKKLNVLNY